MKMKKTILVLLTTFFTLNPSLITPNSSQFALSDDIFDPEIERQIMEEGAKKSKERAEAKKRAEEEAKKQAERIVFVKGGTFNMQGKKITLSSFYMSKYETTQAEYQAIMGSNPSEFKGINLPVEKLSWFDAIKFCNAKSKKEGLSVAYKEDSGDLLDSTGNVTSDITKVKGYRLPTEAEWEFAAKGGNKSQGYKYSGSNSLSGIANFCDVNCDMSWKDRSINDRYENTSPVGNYSPNELGIYDMSGNVWEWCTDWYDSDYYKNGTTINPVNTKSSDYRVYRGGSWYYNAITLRIGYRDSKIPTDTSNDLGVRYVRTAG